MPICAIVVKLSSSVSGFSPCLWYRRVNSSKSSSRISPRWSGTSSESNELVCFKTKYVEMPGRLIICTLAYLRIAKAFLVHQPQRLKGGFCILRMPALMSISWFVNFQFKTISVCTDSYCFKLKIPHSMLRKLNAAQKNHSRPSRAPCLVMKLTISPAMALITFTHTELPNCL